MAEVTIAKLASHFLLPEAFFREGDLDFQEHHEPEKKHFDGTVSFTYGKGARRRIRVSLNSGDSNYIWWPRSRAPIVPYGANLPGWFDFIREHRYVILVEGESDYWVLRHNELPGLGIPGVDMAGKLQREHLEGLEKVFIVQENDQGGKQFVENIRTRVGQLFRDDDSPLLQVMQMGDLDLPGDGKASPKLKDPVELWKAVEAEPSYFKSHLERQKAIGEKVNPIQPSPDRRFNLIRGRAIEDLPKPDWLVDGVLIEGNFAMLYGESGIGKSVLVLDMAAHIATGRKWAGHEVRKGKVLYIIAEGVGDIQDRIRAWRKHYGLEGVDDLDYVIEPVYLDVENEDDVRVLIEQVEESKTDYILVIVDTLARSMLGDENSTRDMGKVIRACDQLRHRLRATVLLVHHTGKDGKLPRGAYALFAAVDTSMKLNPKSTDLRELVCDKQKMSAPFPSMRFELTTVEPSVVMVPAKRGWDGGETYGETNDRRALSLRLVSLRPLTYTEWKNAAAEKGVNKSNFDRDRIYLVEEGFVDGSTRKRGGLYRITEQGHQHLEGLGFEGET